MSFFRYTLGRLFIDILKTMTFLSSTILSISTLTMTLCIVWLVICIVTALHEEMEEERTLVICCHLDGWSFPYCIGNVTSSYIVIPVKIGNSGLRLHCILTAPSILFICHIRVFCNDNKNLSCVLC